MIKILTPLTLDLVEQSESMVAAAVYVDAGEASHAALVIRHNDETKVLHFFGSVILESPKQALDDGLFIYLKELDFIPSFLVASFMAHCQLIQAEAKPEYGFFYDPKGFYGRDGKYSNPGDFPEYMTCVGFCLTVIQSYLIKEEFLHYADWDQTSYDLDPVRMAYRMVQLQRNYPHLKPEDLMKVVRRILPVEYLSGAYGQIPVRKKFTDDFSAHLLDEIARRVA